MMISFTNKLMRYLFFIYAFSFFFISSQIFAEQQNSTMQDLLLEVFVNEKRMPGIVHALQQNDDLYFSKDDLISWRLDLEKFSQSVPFKGKHYYLVRSNTDVKITLDLLRLRVSIDVLPIFFQETVIDDNPQSTKYIAPQPSQGGFLNYDVVATHETQKFQLFTDRKSSFYNISAHPEVGVFSHGGVGTSDFLLTKTGVENRITRLNTAWVHDNPEKMHRWTVGDTITRPTDWGGSARIGGIQWSTNFTTRPNFITFPLPNFKGTAGLPSTVDVFVDNALRMNKDVESGPLRIDNLPVVSGQGTATVVTRDLLGRETILMLPYNTNIQLLKPGLEDFSYEAGLLRRNFGLKSGGYHQPVGVATYNRGLTETWTLGGHSELHKDQQNIGFTTNNAVSNWGIVSGSLAVSHSRIHKKMGHLVQVGFQRSATPLSFGLIATFTHPTFRHIGLTDYERSGHAQYQGFAGYSLAEHGSISATYTLRRHRDESAVRLMTASYQRNVWGNLYLNVGGTRVSGRHKDTTVFASLTMNVGDAGSLSTYVTQNSRTAQQTVQLNKSIPTGRGYGYQLAASNAKDQHRSDQTLDGTVYYQNERGEYFGRAAQLPGSRLFQGGISGSFVGVDSKIFPARQSYDGFALVQIPDFPNVRIYRDNQDVGTTNEEGDLIVPNLRSYELQNFRADLKDFPLSTDIKQIESSAATSYRSAMIVQLKAKKTKSVFLKLTQPDGSFVPAGSTVRFDHEEKDYPVGYDGDVYIPLPFTYDHLKGQVSLSSNTCHFQAEVPKTDDPIVELKNIVCQ